MAPELAPIGVMKGRNHAGCTSLTWSGRRDLNPRLLAPKASALPSCATPRLPSAPQDGTLHRG